MSGSPLPFSCSRCAAQDRAQAVHFAPTDTWIFRYPQDRLIHIHYGTSTSSDKESTTETQFIYGHAIKWFEHEAPQQLFCSVIDFTRGDDSESPSSTSMDLYKAMLTHPQNGLAIFYGMTPSMSFFLSMLRRFSKAGKHMRVAKTIDDAEAACQQWATEQSDLTSTN